MAAGGAEAHFAKKLANNEKIIRDRAVSKLRAWISSRPKDGPGTVVLNYNINLLINTETNKHLECCVLYMLTMSAVS